MCSSVLRLVITAPAYGYHPHHTMTFSPLTSMHKLTQNISKYYILKEDYFFLSSLLYIHLMSVFYAKQWIL